MSRNKHNLTSVLVDVTKWSGKWSFTFFVLSLILVAVSVSLADPSGTVHYISDDNSGQFATYDAFSLSNDDTVQLVMETVTGETFEYRLQKVDFKNPESNETSPFRGSSNDVEIYTIIIAVNDYDLYRNENLERGEYRIQIKGDAGEEVFLGYAHFELGLVSASAVLLVIFSVVFSIFNMVWPFALFALIISAFIPDDKSGPDFRPSSPAQRQQVQRVDQEETRTSQQPQTKVEQRGARTSSEILTGTPLEHLKKNDWIGVFIAFIFLILFFVNPSGPYFFFFLITVFIVGYSVTEREKLQDRLIVLLQMYPKTTLKFLSQQLDKKEKDVTTVLRFMILDDAYPIRLDLVNKTVEKIGVFPEEGIRSQAEVTSRPVSVSVPISQSPEETVEKPESPPLDERTVSSEPTTEGTTRGEITEPAAYCSACGEPLMKETKYCYHCGARQ